MSCINSCAIIPVLSGVVGGLIGAALWSCSCGETGMAGGGVFAEFWLIGAQAAGASLPAGTPLTLSTAGVVKPGITSALLLTQGGTGTVFTLENPGTYEIAYRAGYTGNGSISLYTGTVATSLVQLDKSVIGHGVVANDASVSASLFLTSYVPNFLFSLNAAAGNVAGLSFPLNPTATNLNVTSVTIQLIGSPL